MQKRFVVERKARAGRTNAGAGHEKQEVTKIAA